MPLAVVLLTAALAQGRGNTLNVFAAASLKEAFTAIARDYERMVRTTRVELTFGGSQQLAAQIREGAPADVFASASPEPMDRLMISQMDRRIFAKNRLSIVTGTASVRTIRDLARPLRLVVADSRVPVGKYAAEFIDRAAKRLGKDWRTAVERNVVSREQDVRAVLAKVRLREADAGIVYHSDVISAGAKVREVPIPLDLSPIANYPVTAIGARPGEARAFIKFLFTTGAQRRLAEAGFLSPFNLPTKSPPRVATGAGIE